MVIAPDQCSECCERQKLVVCLSAFMPFCLFLYTSVCISSSLFYLFVGPFLLVYVVAFDADKNNLAFQISNLNKQKSVKMLERYETTTFMDIHFIKTRIHIFPA